MNIITNINTLGISVELSNPSNPIIVDNVSYFPLGQVMNIVVTGLTQNDVILDLSDYTISYSILDPDNTLFTNGSTLTKLGRYIITITIIRNSDGFTYNIISYEECVDPIEFSFTSDSKVLVTNNNLIDVSVVITDAFTSEIVAPLQTIGAGISMSFEISDISFYLVNVLKSGIHEFYLVNNYYLLNSCVTSYIADTLCKEEKPCGECPEPIELNRVIGLHFMLLSKINDIYGKNNFYSTVDNVPALDDIETILTTLKKYCARKGCIGERKSNTKKSDCGCK